MAYARFGKDSDVYVYLSITDKYVCCSCALQEDATVYDGYRLWPDTNMDTPEQVIEHLREHVGAGHRVPDRAFERLEKERLR